MMRDHERIEELLVAHALDALDPDAERELREERAAHGPDCARCRRLEAGYAGVAEALAFSLDPVPVRPGLEDEVVAAARAARRPRDVPAPRAIPAWRRPLAAVAAAAVLFAGGLAVGRWTSPSGPTGVPAGARVVAFQGEGASGSLAVAFEPGKKGVYIVGADLPEPPSGSVYEVWMIQDDTPVPGPCVRPEADGSLFAYADTELGTTETMAVTVEPADCPAAPSSDPVFTATIRS